MIPALLSLGFSDAARYVEKETFEERRQLNKSHAFGIESTLREDLATVWEECRQANWDGYEAFAVTQDTLRDAYVFLESLPFGFPAPSIGAEPDGSLTFE